jgi:hypothetical protein
MENLYYASNEWMTTESHIKRTIGMEFLQSLKIRAGSINYFALLITLARDRGDTEILIWLLNELCLAPDDDLRKCGIARMTALRLVYDCN